MARKLGFLYQYELVCLGAKLLSCSSVFYLPLRQLVVPVGVGEVGQAILLKQHIRSGRASPK